MGAALAETDSIEDARCVHVSGQVRGAKYSRALSKQLTSWSSFRFMRVSLPHCTCFSATNAPWYLLGGGKFE